MKKIVLAVMASLAWGVSQAQSYKITGNVEGMSEGRIFVAAFSGKVVDTLARADVKEGKFELTGKVEEPIVNVRLLVEGQQVTVPFYLENENYTATICPTDPSRCAVEGGVNQTVFNKKKAIELKSYMRLGELQAQMQQAKSQAEVDSLQRCMTEANRTEQAEKAELIKAYPDSPVSAHIVLDYTSIYLLPFVKERYEMLSEKGKATKYGKEAKEAIGWRERIALNYVIPDFSFTNTADKKMNLYDVKGKMKVLVFWKTDVARSREALNKIAEFYDELHGKGLEIVCVSMDEDKSAWKESLKNDKLPWTHGIALGKDRENVEYLFRIGTFFPNVFVLDGNNKIVARHKIGDELKNLLTEGLK